MSTVCNDENVLERQSSHSPLIEPPQIEPLDLSQKVTSNNASPNLSQNEANFVAQQSPFVRVMRQISINCTPPPRVNVTPNSQITSQRPLSQPAVRNENISPLARPQVNVRRTQRSLFQPAMQERPDLSAYRIEPRVSLYIYCVIFVCVPMSFLQ